MKTFPESLAVGDRTVDNNMGSEKIPSCSLIFVFHSASV